MAELTDLPKFIKTGDVYNFIRTYVACINAGYSIGIPRQKDRDELEQAWTQLLQRVANDFDDEFLVDLVDEWELLLRGQDASSDKEFMQYAMKKLGIRMATEADASTASVAESGRYMQNNGLKSSISQKYYDMEQAAGRSQVDSAQRLDKIQLSIKKNKAIPFLYYHLSVCQDGVIPQVPKSTVLSVLNNKWEEIILEAFNQIPSEDFLHDLSSEWAYLLTQHGIPTHAEDYQGLLLALASRHPKQLAKKTTSQSTKGSFFKRLFSD